MAGFVLCGWVKVIIVSVGGGLDNASQVGMFKGVLSLPSWLTMFKWQTAQYISLFMIKYYRGGICVRGKNLFIKMH